MNFFNKEEKILEFWEKHKIFKKSLEEGKEEFTFYDGPPFATGLPHYGHILASIIKDVIPRYQTMKGMRVPRKWGWDCHGLPIENLVETELGLKTKKDIEEYGIDKFNEKARESVLRYADEWKKIVPRIGRWVDMDDDYKTMDTNYTESVWWVFKSLYEKGLIYEGYKPMHICPRCETTLSNFEVTQNYKEIEDISVVVKFQLESDPNTFILAWTTTPWTLPANVALAVDKDLEYVKVESSGAFYILAKNRVDEIFKDKKYKIKKEFKGKDLIGKKYSPLFSYFIKDENLKNKENGWKIYAADFVTMDEGTGVVHIAPAFGAEDMELGEKENLPFIQHVSMDGKFKPEVKDPADSGASFAGMAVKPKANPKETDKIIVDWLKKNNKLFGEELIVHSYPFCWRCETPLLNYAASSWFVKVVKIKDRLLKNNQKINWVPKHLKEGRFGKWLEGAHDWAISRSRYWGAPLPVWKCNECEEIKVVGSINEIKDFLPAFNDIFLVRHGESVKNTHSVLSSLPEIQKYFLTEKGRKQIKEVAKKLKEQRIDMIFSSPLTRTKETAEIIAKELGLDVIFDDRLVELGLGDFNGKKPEELSRVYPTRESRMKNTAYGLESGEEVRARMQEFLDEINNKYKDKKIVVVSHGDPIQILYGITKGIGLLDSLRGWYPAEGSLIHVYSRPVDLHRPYIDEIKLNCKCGGEMSRVSEVFDCWFESGSMPYGQLHYPFENKKEFENNFPANFIAEGVDQTRGWFYTLLVLSVALFDKPAYKNVIANGIILSEDGQKMSKRLKNYPDPIYIVEKYGADCLRYYLLSSPAVRGDNLNFSEKGVDEVNKKVISKIKNVLSFYKMYADEPLVESSQQLDLDNVLDKWIMGRLNMTIGEITDSLNSYELDKATRPLGNFVDDLSNWYLRRSRDRFKNSEKEEAKKTLEEVLLVFSRLLAPFVPFVAEAVYQQIGGKKESVHLEDWPKKNEKLIDKNLLRQMEEVRQYVSAGLDLRLKAGIRVRQPLALLKIRNINSEIRNNDELLQLIKDELNVKEIIFGDSISGEIEIDTKLTKELIEEGYVREIIRAIQDLRKRAGLMPKDEAVLAVEADKNSQDFISKFIDQIKKSTNLKSIKFSKNNGHEVRINKAVWKMEIIKS